MPDSEAALLARRPWGRRADTPTRPDSRLLEEFGANPADLIGHRACSTRVRSYVFTDCRPRLLRRNRGSSGARAALVPAARARRSRRVAPPPVADGANHRAV